MATSGGAGKDTIANYIVNTLAHNTYYKQALGLPIHELAEQFSYGAVERHHLQDLGEAMRNIFGEDVWMKYLDKSKRNSNAGLVIPDIRKLIEYSHYCVERNYAPLYIKVDRKIAKERLKDRDGGYNEEDLKRSIERQLNFIEELETQKVGDSGLEKVYLPGSPFNDIYVINNSGDIQNTYLQVDDWWKREIEKWQ